MKTLPLEIPKNKFLLRQIRREGVAAIYAQHQESGRVQGYEVIRIREGKEWSAFGKTYPAAEIYPSSEQWGTYGWTYSCLADAERRFRKLAGPAIQPKAREVDEDLPDWAMAGS